MFFRIHAKISEVCFEVSTPSIGTKLGTKCAKA
jgi:hypothetical protein